MSLQGAFRFVAVVSVTGLLMLGDGAQAVSASMSVATPTVMTTGTGDDVGATTADNPFGFDLDDSHGISVWDMNLSMSKGSSWNPSDWDKRMWASVMDGAWASYRIVTAVEIWILNWALTLDWMDWVLSPMRGLSQLVGDFMDQLGLMPLMLILLAVVGSWWLLRGRYAGGVVELLIGCVIASLALGALSDPMETIAGDDGMLRQGRDAGIELASAVASGEVGTQVDVDEYRSGLTTVLVDTMIRIPHQIINYGQVIDGTSCEAVYDGAVAGDDARSKVSNCNEQMGQYADSPDAMKGMTALSVLPTAYFLSLFSMLLVGLVLVTVLGAAWTAVRLIPQLLMGIVPGPSRAGLFRSLAMAVFAMFMLTSAIVFVVVWMQFLQSFFGSSSGLPWIVRIYLVNILLVVGGVVMWVFRSKAKKAFKNVADRLASLGASSMAPSPSSLPRLFVPRLPSHLPRHAPQPLTFAPPPTPGPIDIGELAVKGAAVRSGASVVGASVRQLIGASVRSSPPPSTPGPVRPQLPGPVGPGLSAGPSRTAGSAARLRGRLAQGASLAIQAGAAVATSGGSAAATAGTRALAAGGAKAVAAKTAKSVVVRSAAGAAQAAHVRARLHAVQMRQVGDHAVDETTGRSYTVRPSPTPGVQILQPSAERPRQRGGAA